MSKYEKNMWRKDMDKKLISKIYINDNKAYSDSALTKLLTDDVVNLCIELCGIGADGIYINDVSDDDYSHDSNILLIKKICSNCASDVYVSGTIKKFEDIKKYLYAGAKSVLVKEDEVKNSKAVQEGIDRFGKKKVGIIFDGDKGIKTDDMFTICECDSVQITDYLKQDLISGVVCDIFNLEFDYNGFKDKLSKDGINTSIIKSSISFSEFKTDENGLIPVVVTDFKSDEVLMLAYMNEEAFNLTVTTGRMTYYSRSRQEIWVKGLTSGHYQYVKSIDIDCDKDTLLAKVHQIGAACHTGNRSCFYTNLFKKEYTETNPLKVFTSEMNTILDRKAHPKEGSYTNYLFDKGIDKILKKVGEEATEIVIAAKNPEPEEIKYEIADFLYHVMVLMAEKGVTWEDITDELSKR